MVEVLKHDESPKLTQWLEIAEHVGMEHDGFDLRR